MGPIPAVADVRWHVRAALRELDTGELALVACSGGPDSLALAAAAAFEGPRVGRRVGAVTVDHGLQAGSAERARTLVPVLRELDLEPVEVLTVAVGASGGPEAAARTARYAALDEAAERLGGSMVLLGHTRDDQAETVLLGLARGSGARSLAGMAPTVGRYRRPLLDVDRETTRSACHAERLSPWDDPHNSDPELTRAGVRHEALPVLERVLGGGVSAALARSAELLRADADALDAWAHRAASLAAAEPDAADTGPGAGSGGADRGARCLDIGMLAGLPLAVRTRVLRQAAVDAGCPPGSLTAAHVRSVDALVTSWRGQRRVDLPGRVTACRRYGKLLFT